LKTIMSEVANVLQDSRFARLAGVDAFVRRLSSALGYIEKLGMEDAVEPYLADA
jgi:N-glycosylase/DNA lyase